MSEPAFPDGWEPTSIYVTAGTPGSLPLYEVGEHVKEYGRLWVVTESTEHYAKLEPLSTKGDST